MLDVRDPPLDLSHIEVGVSGKVPADGRVGVSQGAVKGGAAQADHHGDEAEQEEEEAGVSAAHLVLIAVIGDFEADASLRGGFGRWRLRTGNPASVIHADVSLLQYGDQTRSRRHLLHSDELRHVVQ